MELHGKIPTQNVVAIIPARYASTRLPGKMLLEIGGKPLIVRTMEQVALATTIDRVIIATDDQKIFDAVIDAGGEAVMTSPDHASGSDRLAEVAENLSEAEIIVNVQGDEPMISPETIDRAVEAMLSGDADIVTVCEPLTSLYGELLNFNVVKVAVADDGRALYFSRSPMPFPRDASLRYDGDPNRALTEEPELFENFRKHTGLYVYRRDYLLRFTKLPQTRLEKFESLEQLRALEDGAVIKVVDAAGKSVGVDTAADFDSVRLKVEFPGITFRQGSVEDIPALSAAYLRSVRSSYRGFLPDEHLDGLTVEGRNQVFAERRSAHEDSYGVIVAGNATGVVGLIDFAHRSMEEIGCDGHVFSFYLVPEVQRKGLGGILFRTALRRMHAEGYSSVWLDTFENNPYRGFYDQQGGESVGVGAHEVNGEQQITAVYRWTDLSKI